MRCFACGWRVDHASTPPDVHDEVGWKRIEEAHAPTCAWLRFALMVHEEHVKVTAELNILLPCGPTP